MTSASNSLGWIWSAVSTTASPVLLIGHSIVMKSKFVNSFNNSQFYRDLRFRTTINYSSPGKNTMYELAFLVVASASKGSTNGQLGVRFDLLNEASVNNCFFAARRGSHISQGVKETGEIRPCGKKFYRRLPPVSTLSADNSNRRMF